MPRLGLNPHPTPSCLPSESLDSSSFEAPLLPMPSSFWGIFFVILIYSQSHPSSINEAYSILLMYPIVFFPVLSNVTSLTTYSYEAKYSRSQRRNRKATLPSFPETQSRTITLPTSLWIRTVNRWQHWCTRLDGIRR